MPEDALPALRGGSVSPVPGWSARLYLAPDAGAEWNPRASTGFALVLTPLEPVRVDAVMYCVDDSRRVRASPALALRPTIPSFEQGRCPADWSVREGESSR